MILIKPYLLLLNHHSKIKFLRVILPLSSVEWLVSLINPTKSPFFLLNHHENPIKIMAFWAFPAGEQLPDLPRTALPAADGAGHGHGGVLVLEVIEKPSENGGKP